MKTNSSPEGRRPRDGRAAHAPRGSSTASPAPRNRHLLVRGAVTSSLAASSEMGRRGRWMGQTPAHTATAIMSALFP